jgi:hypothetical protein
MIIFDMVDKVATYGGFGGYDLPPHYTVTCNFGTMMELKLILDLFIIVRWASPRVTLCNTSSTYANKSFFDCSIAMLLP